MKRTFLMLSVVLATAGCDEKKPTPDNAGTTASATATATASAALSASAAPQASAAKPKHDKKKGRGGAGLAGMFLGASKDLTLKDDQKTKIEALGKTLEGDDANPRDEMKALHAVVIDGIKAGKVDVAKVEAEQANVDKAMKARKDKEAEALNGLYATLDPAQRTALVASVREKIKKREERADKWKDGKPGDGKGPDGKPGDGKPGDKPGMMKGPDGKPGMMKGGPGGPHNLERLTKDLELDDGQKTKVQAVLAKTEKADKPDMKAEFEKMRAEMKKRTDALLAAFEKDGFDAKKQEAFTADDKGMKKMGGGMMDPKVLNEILPILKPEQREKFAAKMQQGHGKGGHKMGGPAAPAAPAGDAGAAADDDDDDDDDK